MNPSSQHRNATNAFVTLLTSDHYLPGALVLAESLRLSHGVARKGKLRADTPAASTADFQVVALITPETLSVQSIKALRRSGLFDWIVGVEPIGLRQILASSPPAGISTSAHSKPVLPTMLDSELNAKILAMEKNLALLGRPDLTNTLTKLHAWRLGRDSAHLIAHGASSVDGTSQSWQGFEKVIFLDADTLVLRPIDHLFHLGSSVRFAAAPDTGWPDAFNSGVMVLTPSSETFEAIRAFARGTGSWDGADQGLLNDFFGSEDGDLLGDAVSQDSATAPGGGWKRLSFRYNVTSHGGYTFAPAYQRYGQAINIVHFIGQHKPWNRARPHGSAQPNPLGGPRDLASPPITPDQPDYLLALWHSAFASLYPTSGASSPDSEIEIVHTERGVEVVEHRKFTVPTYHAVWDAEAREEDASTTYFNAPSTYQAVQRRPALEAAYASLPLDGRSSLIAPVPEVARSPSPTTPTQESIDAEMRARDAAVKPAAAIAIPIPASASGLAAVDPADDSDDSPQHFSPPKLSWNPAHEPPPTGPDVSLHQMRTPIDTFYSNAWDAGQRTPRTLAEQKAAFFVPPSASPRQPGRRPQGGPGYIPAQLRRDHVFDNLGSHKPDPSKVKPIFPWETKQVSAAARAPARVFPDEAKPSPPQSVLMTKPESTGSSLSSAAPPVAVQPQRTRGLPANLAFVNAWDQEGAIGNFANAWNRRTRPTSPEKRRSHPTVMETSRTGSREASSARAGDGQRRASPSATYRSASMVGHEQQRRASLGEDVNDSREGEASDSRDGDDESSSDESSSGNEGKTPEIAAVARVAEGRGNTPSPTNPRQAGWPREGPGRGYMRKAENSVHAQMHATPRSPRLSARVLSYSSTATEGEGGRSGGGKFSSSSSASNSTIMSEVAAAARQRAKDRIRPDGWISSAGSAGTSVNSPTKTKTGPYGLTNAYLRGIPGVGAGGVSRSSFGGSDGGAAAYTVDMARRRRETNSSNESQSGESGANSPTALLSPTLGLSPAVRTVPASIPLRNQHALPRPPPTLDEPFSSSPVNTRFELSQSARTHHQANIARDAHAHTHARSNIHPN